MTETTEYPNRREKDRTVDQNLRFTTTIGWGISMILIVTAAVRIYGVIDSRLTNAEANVERLQFRQDLYIERDAATHSVMNARRDKEHADMEVMREYLTLKFGERIP